MEAYTGWSNWDDGLEKGGFQDERDGRQDGGQRAGLINRGVPPLSEGGRACVRGTFVSLKTC